MGTSNSNVETNKKKHCRHANTSNKNVTNIRAGAPQKLKPITADPKLL